MTIEMATGEPIPGSMEKIIRVFSAIRLSLRAKIMLAFLIVIVLMATMNTVLVLEVMRYNREYEAMMTNIITANNINSYIKPAIDTEMWDIVAGKKEFKDGSQYQIITQVNSQIETMMANSNTGKSRIKLEVVRRTMGTLTNYVDRMGEQMARGSRVADNETVLDNIRGVSDVVETTVQAYIMNEVKEADQQYQANQARFSKLVLAYLILLPFVVAFSFAAAWIISASIYIPIKKLHDVTTTITRNDLQALVTSHNVDEITELGMSFNIMIGKIRQLLDSKMKEQENLKKAELRALQAQINPHFLYNTLDTIVWMAQANKSDQVIDIVRALSSFFRIALSKGNDWITIDQEIEHVSSYLTIQKMRYRDILEYHIEVDESLLSATILKLTLQPLVENALYHGIKNKRSGGTITVRVKHVDPGSVLLEVLDDGVGFIPYKLGKIQAALEAEEVEDTSLEEGGFGLNNVNRRIKLYYGKQYGLSIQSRYQEGTRVAVTIPLELDPDHPAEEEHEWTSPKS
jgi:two-component system sensor histidine kinase YesM